MGLSSLSAALSGLRVSQQQIDVIANNVANVGTEGYTRKILPQTSQIVNGRAIGVLSETVVRNVDLRLERDLWTQVSAVSFFDVKSTYLNRVDQFHGAPAANVSVAGEVSKLQDAFAALANSPDDQFLLTDVVDQAQDTARKMNDLADYYSALRNDSQSEATTVVQSINDLLDQVADYNTQARFARAASRTTAAIEDVRDQAVNRLAELIDITVFSRGDGVLVVQTSEGVELAAEQAVELYFNPAPLSASVSYPLSAAGIFVGDPTDNPHAIDITESNIGGRLGGLIELRDQIFPKQTAQLDELAHKLALRFEAQGLRLFTDQTGTVPSDSPPDSSTDPVVSVEYVGFGAHIQVNDAIIQDHSLLQTGTYGGVLQSGANDIIRRVIEYTFSSTEYQMAANLDAATSVDIRAAATGGTTLQDWLGVSSTNKVSSGVSLSNYASIADIVTAGGTSVFGSGATETDTFILRFDDPDFGGGPYDIEIDLRTVVSTGTSAAQDLVDHIIADPDWAAAVTGFNASVSIGTNGELVIESTGNIEIVNSGVEPMSDQGFAFLGIAVSLSEAQDPYFDVKVGNNNAVRITIVPTDTEVELLAKLNAVDGLAAQIDTDGFLSLRPGGDFLNPDFGGDITIIGGPFVTNGAALGGTAAGRTSLDNGVNISQSLFGTYQVLGGGAIEDLTPIIDVGYQSETEVGSGVFVAFRSELLGPSVTTGTEISASISLNDYAQKIINEISQELALINARRTDESTLQNLLHQQLLDESGVNIDEELGNLIVLQTAYSASARIITVVQEIFQELMSIV
ncbi:MAG: flagellar biosynthesis protein FlgK [Alphaproteobacteria bacterium]|nr:MAG: flagellar biosynthesis protein FlgK [Alphaproteobacteria bacterium]